ncbi:glycosyltransferase, partial [Bacteriovoracales bacterium]|nr:glycosyltransferase [Bacteriovoracales bacterium]
MNVLFDHQIFQIQKYGGISRYFYEIIRQGHIDSEVNFKLAVKHSYNDCLKKFNVSTHLSFGESWKFKGKDRLRNYFNKKNAIRSLSNFDIFHPTFYDDYFLQEIKKIKIPFVLTVHDMINELFPEYFENNEQFIQRKKKMILNSDKIIAVSNATKKDILKFYKIDPSKITVIHHATSISEAFIDNKVELPKKYILYIGKRTGYKNFLKFYNSIKNFLKRSKIELVCGGGGRF